MPNIESSKLEHLFATPILVHRWDDSGTLNEQLKSVILSREQAGPGTQKSNVGGWQSTDDFGAWAGEPGKQIIERMMAMTNHATRLLFTQLQTGGQFGWKFAIWANVNRRGEFNKMHFHPGSTWSGVYYVDDGGTVAGDRVSGSLSLLNPVQVASMSFFAMQLPQARAIMPEPGMMVLFPSYVLHSVHPHNGDRPRISIAFNVHKDPYP